MSEDGEELDGKEEWYIEDEYEAMGKQVGKKVTEDEKEGKYKMERPLRADMEMKREEKVEEVDALGKPSTTNAQDRKDEMR